LDNATSWREANCAGPATATSAGIDTSDEPQSPHCQVDCELLVATDRQRPSSPKLRLNWNRDSATAMLG
jgi:hypothetical protein